MPDSAELKNPNLDPARRRLARRPFVFAIASSSILIATAGCCFLTAWLFGPRIVESPKEVVQIASQITDWTLPDGFCVKMGLKYDFFFAKFNVAKFQNQQGRGLLIVGELKLDLPKHQNQDSQIREVIERNSPELKKINLDHRETRTLTVRGLPAVFEIGSGESHASTTRYRQVIGHFRGKSDDAILILQCEEDVLSDEQIDQFLKSIK